jgi:hypothetical protein
VCLNVEGGISVKKLLVIIGFMAVATLSSSAQMHGIGVVQGRVVDDNDAPVAGVAIAATAEGAEKLKGTTNEKGEWKLVGLIRGQWDVSFEKAGFAPSKARVMLESEQTRLWPITIKLKPAQ